MVMIDFVDINNVFYPDNVSLVNLKDHLKTKFWHIESNSENILIC
jgi:hypothetical protein